MQTAKYVKRKLYRLKRTILYPTMRNKWLFYFRFGWRQRLTLRFDRFKLYFNTHSWTSKILFFPGAADGRVYEFPVASILQQNCLPNSCVLDVGANIGFYSILAAKLCSAGEVHAFDIDPDLIYEIQHNVVLNALQNVYLTCAAIWDTDENIFTFRPHMQSFNKTTNSILPFSVTDFGIPTLTLDSYCRQLKIQPDIVKIDVEGAEIKVLRGMCHALNNVRIILLEIHPDLIERLGDSMPDLINILDSYNFRISVLENHRNTSECRLLSSGEVIHLKKNCLLLCENNEYTISR